MNKYKYDIKNFDCANCAKKIEDALNKDSNFENVVVNYSTSKLIYESNKSNHKEIVDKIIKKIEPDVIVVDNSSNTNFKTNKKSLIILITGLILGLLSLLFDNKIANILLISSYVLLLTKISIKAIKILLRNHSLDENMLITISVIGAYFINQPFEGFMVIALYSIGKLLEEKAVNKSRKNVSELMDIRPEYANQLIDNKIITKDPDEINIDDIIVVKVGEKIPLDGIIVKGTTHLNTTALTGESKPITKKENDVVLSGSINLTNVIEIKVTSSYENSTVNKILDLVENATNRKAKAENFVSKAAKIYTPIIIVLSIMTALVLPLLGISTEESIYRALSFLVISCPCAIAISVPLSYFSGIGLASKKGILIKGSDYLDQLRNIETIVFDKTGTLTTGNFTVVGVESYDKKITKDEILHITALGESFSNHPIATAITSFYNKEIDQTLIKNHKEIAGKGIIFDYKKSNYKIGTLEYISNKKEKDISTKTVVYMSKNDNLIGKITLDDEIKEDTISTIKYLNKNNITTIMLTGDNEGKAKEVADNCGITEYYSNLLPQDKYDIVSKKLSQKQKGILTFVGDGINDAPVLTLADIVSKKLSQKQKGILTFVGDGINDAPVLTLADIGISMGQIGSSSAIEASDVVIMTDELNKIVEGINISKYTSKIIKQNLIFSIGTKLIFIFLNVFGLSTMFLAVFADVGVTVIAILNSIRILKK